MKNESYKVVIKQIFFIAIVGLALTALAGCGISQGPYHHGYNGRNYRNNADNYRDGSGYSGKLSGTPGYKYDSSGYGTMMGYDPDRSGYCR